MSSSKNNKENCLNSSDYVATASFRGGRTSGCVDGKEETSPASRETTQFLVTNGSSNRTLHETILTSSNEPTKNKVDVGTKKDTTTMTPLEKQDETPTDDSSALRGETAAPCNSNNTPLVPFTTNPSDNCTQGMNKNTTTEEVMEEETAVEEESVLVATSVSSIIAIPEHTDQDSSTLKKVSKKRDAQNANIRATENTRLTKEAKLTENDIVGKLHCSDIDRLKQENASLKQENASAKEKYNSLLGQSSIAISGIHRELEEEKRKKEHWKEKAKVLEAELSDKEQLREREKESLSAEIKAKIVAVSKEKRDLVKEVENLNEAIDVFRDCVAKNDKQIDKLKSENESLKSRDFVEENEDLRTHMDALVADRDYQIDQKDELQRVHKEGLDALQDFHSSQIDEHKSDNAALQIQLARLQQEIDDLREELTIINHRNGGKPMGENDKMREILRLREELKNKAGELEEKQAEINELQKKVKAL